MASVDGRGKSQRVWPFYEIKDSSFLSREQNPLDGREQDFLSGHVLFGKIAD